MPRRPRTGIARIALLLTAAFTTAALALTLVPRREGQAGSTAALLRVNPTAAASTALPPLPLPSSREGFPTVQPRRELPAAQRSGPATATLTGRAEPGADGVAFALTHTRVVARVTGNVARVEVVQRFHNPTDRRLEALYVFPLPEAAAVTDMTFQIG